MKCLHNRIPKDLRTVDKSYALVPINGRIYWHLDEAYLTDDLEKYKIVIAFEKTFQAWQPYFKFKFASTGNKKEAAIIIRFMNNDHSELPFKFEAETLAYAFFPKKKSLGIESDMYFNDHYRWSEMHKPGQVNLFKVAVHEVGHAFGLDHSKFIEDIMYPTYQPNDSVVMTKDTVKGIEGLYGKVGRTEPEAGPGAEPGFLEWLKKILQILFPSLSSLRRLSRSQLLQLIDLMEIRVRPGASRTELSQKILKEL